MPLRTDFLENIMIRATPVNALNDPFEGFFNKEQVRDADYNHGEFYKERGIRTGSINDVSINDIIGDIQCDILELGIISFTEDYSNPLMWAHYADDHRGMVIEFDFNENFFMDAIKEVDGRKSRFGARYLADCFEFPKKVNYRREMPRFDRPELSAPDSMSEFHWNKFNRTILFTKSNDWLYEKEQRIIVQLQDADSIICNDSNHVRSQCARDSRIILKQLENKKIQITYPNEYEMHENMGDESIKTEIHRLALDYNDPPIHLFRINPKAISGVYFGCKAKEGDALEIIKCNKSLEKLGNIYKMRIDNTLYQLNPVAL